MKLILLFFTSFLILNISKGQSADFHWAHGHYSNLENIGKLVATDGAGNVYYSGNFGGTLDFDPGPGNFSMTSSMDDTDVYLVKLDPFGNFIWAKQFTNNSNYFSSISAIVFDLQDNLYITGFYFGIIDFNPGPGAYNLQDYYASFLLKLSTAGNFMWVKSTHQTGNNTNESCRFSDLKINNNGDLFITGQFLGTTDFNLGPGIDTLTSINDIADIFILKLDSSGNFIRVTQFGGIGDDVALSLDLDAFNNIALLTSFHDTIQFGNTTFNSFGGYDVSIVKFDSAFNVIWANQIGGSFDQYCGEIKIDNTGNIILTGSLNGSADFDPGQGVYFLTSNQNDGYFFVAKYDTNGNLNWAKSTGTHLPNLALDLTGNIYLASFYTGIFDFDPGPAIYYGIAWYTNLAILKLDPSGNFTSLNNLECTSNVRSNDFTIDNSDNLYLTGGFAGTLDVDPGIGNYYLLSANYMSNDFILKLSPHPLGMDDLDTESEITIYPNPMLTDITIQFDKMQRSAKLEIVDVMGKTVNTQYISGHNFKIQRGNLSSGIYFFRISDDNDYQISRKVIVQ